MVGLIRIFIITCGLLIHVISTIESLSNFATELVIYKECVTFNNTRVPLFKLIVLSYILMWLY